MARFRFALQWRSYIQGWWDTIANSLTTATAAATSDVVNSGAELTAHIQCNIVYLHDLAEADLIIVPPPSGSGARLVVSPTSLYIVRTPDYGIIGRRDR